jgi:hypothetical protein
MGADAAMRHWSDGELETLSRLMKDKMPASRIATVLRRSEAAVARKMERMKAAPKAKRRPSRSRKADVKAKRRCLSCRSMFESEGIGNRICSACKENHHALSHLEGISK